MEDIYEFINKNSNTDKYYIHLYQELSNLNTHNALVPDTSTKLPIVVTGGNTNNVIVFTF